MATRYRLDELRQIVLEILADADDWRTPTEIARKLRAGGGSDWLRVALTLERLAHSGELEIRRADSRGKRWFRLRRPEADA